MVYLLLYSEEYAKDPALSVGELITSFNAVSVDWYRSWRDRGSAVEIVQDRRQELTPLNQALCHPAELVVILALPLGD